MLLRTRRGQVLVAIAAATFGLQPGHANAQESIEATAGPRASARPAFVPGELLVRFERAPDAGRAAALARLPAELERRLPLPGLWRVRLGRGTGVREAAAALARRPGVRYAEPNYYRYPHAVPNDARFAEQWSLDNTGQVVAGTAGKPDADVDAPEAWDLTTGSPDTVVAIVDDGLGYPHSEIRPNLWSNPGETGAGRESNGLDDDANGYVDDWRGWNFLDRDNDPFGAPSFHGTQIAGIIGARGDDEQGIAGLNWRVDLMPLRIYNAFVDSAGTDADAEGDDEAATVARIVKAFRYASENGARVVNASFGHPTRSQAERDAIAAAPEVLFAVSAGNLSRNVDGRARWREFPCNYGVENVVCAAATDNRDRLAEFSNFGPESVDLAAPGENILTTSRGSSIRRPFVERFSRGALKDWTRGGRRGRWRLAGDRRPGDWSLRDSPRRRYRNRANSRIRSPAIDLSGMEDCAVRFWLRLRTERRRDHLFVESSGDRTDWNVRRKLSGRKREQQVVPLPRRLNGDPSSYIRFRLRSNRRVRGRGARVDNLRVTCVEPEDGFQPVSGTSFAAPHVAGAAALLVSADPAASASDLRQRILTGVDPLPGLDGKVVTGGRLNVASALEAP